MTFTNAAVASGGLCGNPNSRGTLLTVRPGPSAREGPRVVPARRTAFLVPKATFWKRIFQSPGDEGQEAGSPGEWYSCGWPELAWPSHADRCDGVAPLAYKGVIGADPRSCRWRGARHSEECRSQWHVQRPESSRMERGRPWLVSTAGLEEQMRFGGALNNSETWFAAPRVAGWP